VSRTVPVGEIGKRGIEEGRQFVVCDISSGHDERLTATLFEETGPARVGGPRSAAAGGPTRAACSDASEPAG
jgi:hypothetical protein